jgi:transcriptional regulator with XRE-family HTH domain
MGRVSIVARRLKEVRLQADLSQKEFGVKAGINEFGASSRMNQYERGVHMPHLHMVKRLAKVVNVPVPYFYCEDAELAEAILKFSALDKAQRKRLLGLMGE